MRVIVDGRVANRFANGLQHGGRIGTGKAQGRALADARGQEDRFRAAFLQYFGPRHSTLARAAAAADEPDHGTGAKFRKGVFALARADEICGAGAEIFRLPAADDAYFFHDFSPSWVKNGFSRK